MRSFLLVSSLLALAACAQRPDAISPVSMGNAFVSVPCRDAHGMLQEERHNLNALSQQQNSAATGDAIGVFLIGVPMSSVGGGDKAGEIATSKGKVVALENRLLSCS